MPCRFRSDVDVTHGVAGGASLPWHNACLPGTCWRLSDSLAGATARLAGSLAGAVLPPAADTTSSAAGTPDTIFGGRRALPTRTMEEDYLTTPEEGSHTPFLGMSMTVVKHSHTSRLKKPRLPVLSRSSGPTAFRHAGGRRVFDFSPPPTDVYVLELARGRVYVGKSGNVPLRRVKHEQGEGSAFTKAFKPTGVMLPRLGNVEGCGDAAERDETLRYMFMKGIQNVRGWKYTQVNMTSQEEEEAEDNIRELFDLCRRCGMPGHFRNVCRSRFDRRGALCA